MTRKSQQQQQGIWNENQHQQRLERLAKNFKHLMIIDESSPSWRKDFFNNTKLFFNIINGRNSGPYKSPIRQLNMYASVLSKKKVITDFRTITRNQASEIPNAYKIKRDLAFDFNLKDSHLIEVNLKKWNQTAKEVSAKSLYVNSNYNEYLLEDIGNIEEFKPYEYSQNEMEYSRLLGEELAKKHLEVMFNTYYGHDLAKNKLTELNQTLIEEGKNSKGEYYYYMFKFFANNYFNKLIKTNNDKVTNIIDSYYQLEINETIQSIDDMKLLAMDLTALYLAHINGVEIDHSESIRIWKNLKNSNLSMQRIAKAIDIAENTFEAIERDTGIERTELLKERKRVTIRNFFAPNFPRELQNNYKSIAKRYLEAKAPMMLMKKDGVLIFDHNKINPFYYTNSIDKEHSDSIIIESLELQDLKLIGKKGIDVEVEDVVKDVTYLFDNNEGGIKVYSFVDNSLLLVNEDKNIFSIIEPKQFKKDRLTDLGFTAIMNEHIFNELIQYSKYKNINSLVQLQRFKKIDINTFKNEGLLNESEILTLDKELDKNMNFTELSLKKLKESLNSKKPIESDGFLVGDLKYFKAIKDNLKLFENNPNPGKMKFLFDNKTGNILSIGENDYELRVNYMARFKKPSYFDFRKILNNTEKYLVENVTIPKSQRNTIEKFMSHRGFWAMNDYKDLYNVVKILGYDRRVKDNKFIAIFNKDGEILSIGNNYNKLKQNFLKLFTGKTEIDFATIVENAINKKNQSAYVIKENISIPEKYKDLYFDLESNNSLNNNVLAKFIELIHISSNSNIKDLRENQLYSQINELNQSNQLHHNVLIEMKKQSSNLLENENLSITNHAKDDIKLDRVFTRGF